MPSPNDIKKGTVIKMDGQLYVVVEFQRVSPGKGSSFVRTRVKSLSSGKVVEQNFKSAETLEFEDVQYRNMQFIFTDGAMYTFMDTGTYEQVTLSSDMIGDDAKYLKEGLVVIITTHNEAPIAMELPRKIDYTIVETEPAVKGDTASGNVSKDAKMDNGLVVRVPIFVKQGETVRVNTESGEYVERVTQ